MTDTLMTLWVRTDEGNERFSWCRPDEIEGDWIYFSVPTAHMIVINKVLNDNITVGVMLLKAAHEAGYEAGFDEDALPPGGMFTL